jgi:hypothetical protein
MKEMQNEPEDDSDNYGFRRRQVWYYLPWIQCQSREEDAFYRADRHCRSSFISDGDNGFSMRRETTVLEGWRAPAGKNIFVTRSRDWPNLPPTKNRKETANASLSSGRDSTLTTTVEHKQWSR